MPHVPKTHTLPFRTPPQNDDRNPQRVRFASELEVFRARARQEETRLAASVVRSPAAPVPLANRSKEPERESATVGLRLPTGTTLGLQQPGCPIRTGLAALRCLPPPANPGVAPSGVAGERPNAHID